MFARPTTSNPKRRVSQNSPVHNSGSMKMSPRGDAPVEADLTAEVLWSNECVPANILARPHTSNPRYVEMNLRDTPRKENNNNGPPGGGTFQAGTGSTSTPQLTSGTPSDGSPSDHRSPAAGLHSNNATVSGVLWASDSDAVDPALLARPVTANPWLNRLFESGEIPDVNWTRREGSQILWSSINVEDWRMLARPHASNPLLERGIGEDATEPSPTVAHKQSEVLWQRDEDDDLGPQQLTIEQPAQQQVTSDVHQQLLRTADVQSQRISDLEGEIRALKYTVQDLVGSIRLLADALAEKKNGHVEDKGAVAATAVAAAPTGRPSPSVLPAARTQPTVPIVPPLAMSTNIAPHRSQHYPVVREDYPKFCPPSPPKISSTPNNSSARHATDASAVTQAAASSSPQPLSCKSADEAEYNSFVKEDNSAIEPQLEGLHSVIDESSVSQLCSQRPESAHVTSKKVVQLREAINGLSRPQSAPLQSYNTVRGGSGARLVTQTTCFSKDGSDSLLLNNKAIVEQYEKLLDGNHPFVLKTHFKDMYVRKAQEFGMVVNEREIDRKLLAFHTVGKEYLSLEEFSVLFLHIAQW